MLKENKRTEIVIMMKLENGKGKMVRALLFPVVLKQLFKKNSLKRKGEKYYLLKNISNIKLMVATLDQN